MKRAWEDRQSRISSVVGSIRNTRVVKKGAVSDDLPPHIVKLYDVNSPLPPEDTTFETHSTLTLSQDRFRYETTNKTWSLRKGEYIDEPYLSTFDGKIGRVFHSWAPGESRPGDGSLRPAAAMFDFRWASILPMMIFCRGADEKMGIDLVTAKIVGQASVYSRKCIEVLISTKGIRTQTKLLVDPARNYLLMRIQTVLDQQPTTSIDVEYQKDERLGFVPATWNTVFMGRNGLKSSIRSELKEFNLPETVTKSVFDLPYPEGAIVTRAIALNVDKLGAFGQLA